MGFKRGKKNKNNQQPDHETLNLMLVQQQVMLMRQKQEVSQTLQRLEKERKAHILAIQSEVSNLAKKTDKAFNNVINNDSKQKQDAVSGLKLLEAEYQTKLKKLEEIKKSFAAFQATGALEKMKALVNDEQNVEIEKACELQEQPDERVLALVIFELALKGKLNFKTELLDSSSDNPIAEKNIKSLDLEYSKLEKLALNARDPQSVQRNELSKVAQKTIHQFSQKNASNGYYFKGTFKKFNAWQEIEIAVAYAIVEIYQKIKESLTPKAMPKSIPKTMPKQKQVVLSESQIIARVDAAVLAGLCRELHRYSLIEKHRLLIINEARKILPKTCIKAAREQIKQYESQALSFNLEMPKQNKEQRKEKIEFEKDLQMIESAVFAMALDQNFNFKEIIQPLNYDYQIEKDYIKKNETNKPNEVLNKYGPIISDLEGIITQTMPGAINRCGLVRAISLSKITCEKIFKSQEETLVGSEPKKTEENNVIMGLIFVALARYFYFRRRQGSLTYINQAFDLYSQGQEFVLDFNQDKIAHFIFELRHMLFCRLETYFKLESLNKLLDISHLTGVLQTTRLKDFETMYYKFAPMLSMPLARLRIGNKHKHDFSYITLRRLNLIDYGFDFKYHCRLLQEYRNITDADFLKAAPGDCRNLAKAENIVKNAPGSALEKMTCNVSPFKTSLPLKTRSTVNHELSLKDLKQAQDFTYTLYTVQDLSEISEKDTKLSNEFLNIVSQARKKISVFAKNPNFKSLSLAVPPSITSSFECTKESVEINKLALEAQETLHFDSKNQISVNFKEGYNVIECRNKANTIIFKQAIFVPKESVGKNQGRIGCAEDSEVVDDTDHLQVLNFKFDQMQDELGQLFGETQARLFNEAAELHAKNVFIAQNVVDQCLILALKLKSQLQQIESNFINNKIRLEQTIFEIQHAINHYDEQVRNLERQHIQQMEAKRRAEDKKDRAITRSIIGLAASACFAPVMAKFAIAQVAKLGVTFGTKLAMATTITEGMVGGGINSGINRANVGKGMLQGAALAGVGHFIGQQLADQSQLLREVTKAASVSVCNTAMNGGKLIPNLAINCGTALFVNSILSAQNTNATVQTQNILRSREAMGLVGEAVIRSTVNAGLSAMVRQKPITGDLLISVLGAGIQAGAGACGKNIVNYDHGIESVNSQKHQSILQKDKSVVYQVKSELVNATRLSHREGEHNRTDSQIKLQTKLHTEPKVEPKTTQKRNFSTNNSNNNNSNDNNNYQIKHKNLSKGLFNYPKKTTDVSSKNGDTSILGKSIYFAGKLRMKHEKYMHESEDHIAELFTQWASSSPDRLLRVYNFSKSIESGTKVIGDGAEWCANKIGTGYNALKNTKTAQSIEKTETAKVIAYYYKKLSNDASNYWNSLSEEERQAVYFAFELIPGGIAAVKTVNRAKKAKPFDQKKTFPLADDTYLLKSEKISKIENKKFMSDYKEFMTQVKKLEKDTQVTNKNKELIADLKRVEHSFSQLEKNQLSNNFTKPQTGYYVTKLNNIFINKKSNIILTENDFPLFKVRSSWWGTGLQNKNVKELSINEIRAWNDFNRPCMYVINKDNKLIITKQIYDHWHLGKGKPVYAAGDIYIKKGTNGSEIYRVDNRSGSYQPKGDHLSGLIETTFEKYGYKEVIGKYIDHEAELQEMQQFYENLRKNKIKLGL